MLKCNNCGCPAHCGTSCMECWECSECRCENCRPTPPKLDEEGWPYPTGDD